MKYFDTNQVDELLNLGLNDQQIQDLDRRVIRISRYHLRSKPKMMDVRDELDSLASGLDNAQKLISDLMRTDDDLSDKGLILNQIIFEDFSLGGDGNLIEKTLYTLSAFNALVDRSRPKLTNEQTRNSNASPYPIQLIVEALNKNSESEIAISSSPTSVFRKIVCVCYEAILGHQTDPERAIKSYILNSKNQSS